MADPSSASSSEPFNSNGASADEVEDKNEFTVSKVVEEMGLTTHHLHLVSFIWWTWIFYGWSSTLLVYALDAAGDDDTNWTKLTSPLDRLTVQDKSVCLLVGGVLAVFGNPILSFLSDVSGRVTAMELGLVGTIVIMVSCALARSRPYLLCLLCVYPAGGPALITQSLLSEWLPSEWRGILSTTLHALWNVGRLAITFLWVVLPPSDYWTAFFFAGAIPPLLLEIFVRFRGWRYESPRVLAVMGDAEGSVSLLKLAVESNTTKDPHLLRTLANPCNLRLDDRTGSGTQIQSMSWREQLSELFVAEFRPLLAVLSIVHFNLAFSCTVLFLWIMEYLKTIGMTAAIRPSMMAAPVGKMVSGFLLVAGGRNVCAIDRLPLMTIIQVGFLGNALCLAGFLICRSTAGITIACFFSHFFEEFVWVAGSIYVIESFPTTVRNCATGLMTAVVSVGGIVGATTGGLLMEIKVYLPILTLIAALLLGALSSCFLKSERFRGTLNDTGPHSNSLSKSASGSYGACEPAAP
mmetsp:Transcript_43837/g.82210  ORF Transcript_43837/g.82210 Transcript_43837/m.82210 type:complete len:521 (+) Transcript_43837:54-1616(+)